MVSIEQNIDDELSGLREVFRSYWIKLCALLWLTMGIILAGVTGNTARGDGFLELLATGGLITVPIAYWLSPRELKLSAVAWSISVAYFFSALAAIQITGGYILPAIAPLILAIIVLTPIVKPIFARLYLYFSVAASALYAYTSSDAAIADESFFVLSRIPGIFLMTLSGLVVINSYAFMSNQIVKSYALLKSRQEAQTRMFAIIGHELRTPVSSINLMAQLDQHADYKADLIDASSQLLHTLDDLRSVTNPENTIKLSIEAFSVEKMIQSLRAELTSIVDRYGLTLTIDAKLDNRYWYRSDSHRIQTILSNFVRNACKHSGGSEVTLEINFNTETEELTFDVSDNGNGVDSGLVDKLFSPFVKGTESSDGTGLGLYITKQWAKALGGSVLYRPAEKGGASFKLRIPAHPVPIDSVNTAVDASMSQAKSILSSARVLLVEDDRMLQVLHSKLLRKNFGCDVEIAEDGSVALEMLVDQQYDLVLTDYFMPHISGKELITVLRMTGNKQLVMAITAATVGDEQSDLLTAGADAVLSKPLDATEFARAFVSAYQQNQRVG